MTPSEILHVGSWEVDPAAGCIRSAARELRLEPRLMRILIVLAHAHGRIVTKDQLIEAAWDNAIISDDAITSAIYRLRRSLAGEDRPYIETASRRGYRLVAPVRLGDDTSAPHRREIDQAYEALNELSARGLRQARLMFEASLEHDPASAAAASGLAEALALGAWTTGLGACDALSIAHNAALSAQGRDPEAAPSLRAAALTFAFHRQDYEVARTRILKALALTPDRPTLRATALILAAEGDFASALRHLDAAIDINPTSLSFGYIKAQMLILARDYRAAIAEADRLIELYPQFAPPWTARGWALHFLQDEDGAVATFRDSLTNSGVSKETLERYDAAAQGGAREVFRFIYSLLAAPSLNAQARTTDLAFLCAQSGDHAAAIAHLRKAKLSCDPLLAYAPYLPYLDPLRDLAEFRAVFPR